jgi:hypothetical protein
MPLTDIQLKDLYSHACQVWGKTHSASNTYPNPDPTVGDFRLESVQDVISIARWTHDSPQPSLTDLKSLDLTDVRTRRKESLGNGALSRLGFVFDYLVDSEIRLSALERNARNEQQAREYIHAIVQNKFPEPDSVKD